jgi:NTP pyrophosphatase (non-canonical NTP hydrolase)
VQWNWRSGKKGGRGIMLEKSIYRRALNLWGNIAQINMAIEECAELIVKLSKSDRRSNGVTVEEITEEIADVEIMMAQLRIIFGDETVEKAKNKKLTRLEERVKYGEGTA